MTDRNDLYLLAEELYFENRSVFEAMEKRRINHLVFIGLFSIAGIFAGIIGLAFLEFYFFFRTFPIPVNAALGFAIALITSFCALDQSYRHRMKLVFIYKFAEKMGMRYRHGGYISLGDTNDHQILPPYSSYRIEDGFKTRINGFKISFQDFLIKPVTRWSKFDFRSLSSSFYGLLIRIELNKPIKYHTVMMPAFLANGLLKRQLHSQFHDFETIRIPYSRFNSRYTLLSEHQVEARYIFDPAVIERIIQLGDVFNARWFEVSVKNGEMIMIIGQPRNLFEPGHLLDVVDIPSIERVLSQINALKEIVHILELNPYAGLGAARPEPLQHPTDGI